MAGAQIDGLADKDIGNQIRPAGNVFDRFKKQ
jgi:hypothetical protein